MSSYFQLSFNYFDISIERISTNIQPDKCHSTLLRVTQSALQLRK